MNKDTYYEKSIEELKKHANIANEEMAVIKTDISWIKDTSTQHIQEDREAHKAIDDKIFWALCGIIVSVLVPIIIALIPHLIR